MTDAASLLQPPPAYALLSGIGMLLVAVVAVALWRARTGAAWRATALGAAAWAVGVALKVAWAVPTNKLVLGGLKRALGDAAGGAVGYLYIGLLTGIFEVGVTWLFVAKTRLRSSSREDAIAFGIGFGAVEAFVLGLASLAGIVVALVAWDKLPAGAKELLGGAHGALPIALPIFERAYALLAHLVCCILVVWAVQLERARWFWVAFVFKSLVDAMAVWGIDFFDAKSAGPGYIKLEIALFAFVACSTLAIYLLRPTRGRGATPASPYTAVLG